MRLGASDPVRESDIKNFGETGTLEALKANPGFMLWELDLPEDEAE